MSDKDTIAVQAAALSAKTKEIVSYRRELAIADELYTQEVLTRRLVQREADALIVRHKALLDMYELKCKELECKYEEVRKLRKRIDQHFESAVKNLPEGV